MCSTCYTREYMRSYRKKNRDKVIEHRKTYKDSEKGKAVEDAYRKRNWQKIREKQYLRSLWKKYGLLPEEYRRLLQRQKGKCAVCKKIQERKLCVDHDHASGTVRGLLCTHCNTAIGHLDGREEWTRQALRYLRRFAFQP